MESMLSYHRHDIELKERARASLSSAAADTYSPLFSRLTIWKKKLRSWLRCLRPSHLHRVYVFRTDVTTFFSLRYPCRPISRFAMAKSVTHGLICDLWPRYKSPLGGGQVLQCVKIPMQNYTNTWNMWMRSKHSVAELGNGFFSLAYGMNTVDPVCKVHPQM